MKMTARHLEALGLRKHARWLREGKVLSAEFVGDAVELRMRAPIRFVRFATVMTPAAGPNVAAFIRLAQPRVQAPLRGGVDDPL